ITRHPFVHFRGKANHIWADVVNQSGALDFRIVHEFNEFARACGKPDGILKILPAASNEFLSLGIETLHRRDVNVDVDNRRQMKITPYLAKALRSLLRQSQGQRVLRRGSRDGGSGLAPSPSGESLPHARADSLSYFWRGTARSEYSESPDDAIANEFLEVIRSEPVFAQIVKVQRYALLLQETSCFAAGRSSGFVK